MHIYIHIFLLKVNPILSLIWVVPPPSHQQPPRNKFLSCWKLYVVDTAPAPWTAITSPLESQPAAGPSSGKRPAGFSPPSRKQHFSRTSSATMPP